MLTSRLTIDLTPILQQVKGRNARRLSKSPGRIIGGGLGVVAVVMTGLSRESPAVTIACSVFRTSSQVMHTCSASGGSPFVCRGGRHDDYFSMGGFKVKKSKRT